MVGKVSYWELQPHQPKLALDERVGRRGGWIAVCKDSQEQFGPIMIKENHLAVDREMKIQQIV